MSKVVKLEKDVALVLPPSITGLVEVSRLLREIEAVDYDFESQSIRNPSKTAVVPAISRRLSELCEVNSMTVEDADARKSLISRLRIAKDKAPVLHIAFATEPEPAILTQLVAWTRQKLHPAALITVGVQPGLVGGCVVRTPDHIYDFSFRNHLRAAQPVLRERLGAL
jgi:hypothetical protein